ncbi:NAD(P)H-hydrate dehydratase [Candidatus Peregrinibacteria bacterium CG10_big_fil_rev_8_21_14_0_10_55_24]|nr:MAG: NAD(P)H-hydrate dehydratase [Candidatus Peregrinibacteria bacterium CG10_big_fil_rev_8_21_14_0_10_55_24]
MQRSTDSHKGENGKVAIVGGSRTMHGAPIFSALAAEATGVDLLYLALPACHEDAAKNASLNVQVHPFAGENLGRHDVEPILELLATMDCAVLGPGIDHGNEESVRALMEIIEGASCTLVLDATALQPKTLSLLRGKASVLTPHLGELERMELLPKQIAQQAEQFGAVILLKGQTDHIVSPAGQHEDVAGGNAGLTVGGTGDALAGMIAGLIALHLTPFEASVLSSRTIKRAAEELFPEKGYAFTAHDVIERIPGLLRTLGA